MPHVEPSQHKGFGCFTQSEADSTGGQRGEALFNSLRLMSKCSASHTRDPKNFKLRLISTASALDSSLQGGYISSEDPL